MREAVTFWIGAILAAVIGLLGLSGVLHILITIPYPSNNKGAEWVAAIGTVGTLIGTIWLASSDRRERSRRELDFATVIAVEFTEILPNVICATKTVINLLNDEFLTAYGQEYHTMANHLEMAGIWSVEDLTKLIVVPNRTAAKLALARAHLLSEIARFREATTSAQSRTQEETFQFNRSAAENLTSLLPSMEQGYGECVQLVNGEYQVHLPLHR
jgi:hypothetical protein